MTTLYELTEKDADETAIPRVDTEDLRIFCSHYGIDTKECDCGIFSIRKDADGDFMLQPNTDAIKATIRRKETRLNALVEKPLTKALAEEIAVTVNDSTKCYFYITNENGAEIVPEDMFLFNMLDGTPYKVIGTHAVD